MKFRNLIAACQLALFYTTAISKLVVHDSTFQPDIILRASLVEACIACTQRPSVAINGTIPGPLIKLQERKVSWIRVYNDMSNANLTIHWHGLSQSTAPFSDGTPLASQWPIAPKHFFDYELRPKRGEAGTYFYHSHVQFQASTASGPIVVEEAEGCNPPYHFDEDRILHLTELFPKSDSTIVKGLQASPFEWSGEPENLLLNGHAPPKESATELGQCGPEVIEVEPGKNYRFRFIGASALSDIGTVIEDHDELYVIEADGSHTKTARTDHIQTNSGQRYSVYLKAKSEDELKKLGKTDFWIQLNNMYRPTEVVSFALLRYKKESSCHGFSCYRPGIAGPTHSNIPNVPKKKFLAAPQFDNSWLEYTLEPLAPNNFPSASEVTRRVYLTSVQVELDNKKIQFLVSNESWVAQSVGKNYMTNPGKKPYLVSIYEHGQDAIPSLERAKQHKGRDPKFNAYPAEVGEVLEIILINQAGFANTYDVHPWHAHGGHFYDIGSGPGNYDAEKNEKRLKGYNPVLRDTTTLYRFPADNIVNRTEYTPGGWRGWRLRVEDAGVWMVHCHTLQHMIMGMQTTWIMGNASEIKSQGLPPMSNFDVYGKNDVGKRSEDISEMQGYLSYKGAAYGNSRRSPIVNHHFEQ